VCVCVCVSVCVCAHLCLAMYVSGEMCTYRCVLFSIHSLMCCCECGLTYLRPRVCATSPPVDRNIKAPPHPSHGHLVPVCRLPRPGVDPYHRPAPPCYRINPRCRAAAHRNASTAPRALSGHCRRTHPPAVVLYPHDHGFPLRHSSRWHVPKVPDHNVRHPHVPHRRDVRHPKPARLDTEILPFHIFSTTRGHLLSLFARCVKL
jgi:hypothetical protein